MEIRNQRDFWSGLTFLVVGIGFSWGATSYAFGDAAQPGPGYFPFGLGILLALLGAFTLIEALAVETEDGGKIDAWGWRPLFLITASVGLFGWLLPILGLFIALPLLVLVSALAGDEFHWGEALFNAAILTVGSWATFSRGLGLTIPLLPSFLAH